jgi:hypothetical protein
LGHRELIQTAPIEVFHHQKANAKKEERLQKGDKAITYLGLTSTTASAQCLDLMAPRFWLSSLGLLSSLDFETTFCCL